jgi:hypothetical protein
MVEDDAELQGLYGLFANDEVDPREVLAAHHRATNQRIDESGQHVVLVVADTTDFSFGGDSIRDGVGWISRNTQGFFAHVALALSADGMRRPFGVVGMSTFSRERPPPPRSGTKKHHDGKKTCRDDKRESLRWGALVDETTERLRGHAVPIHISDREADAYEYLSGRVSKGQRFVARAKELARPVVSLDDDEQMKLRVAAERAVPLIGRTADISRRRASPFPVMRKRHPPREYRPARLEIAGTRVRIPKPSHLPSTMPASIELNLVQVREIDPPEGVEPVTWFLLTTEPVDTAEDLERVVDYYRARWVIEELFQAIKTGCQYEARQLESMHALLIALAICIPIAWDMLALRHLAREAPDAPASLVVSNERLAALRTIARKPLPKKPSVRDVLYAIAALGGHIARNGPPGWKTLRLGLNDLMIVEAAFAARDRERAGFDE